MLYKMQHVYEGEVSCNKEIATGAQINKTFL